MKLKEEYINQVIYNPFEKRNQVGKFIDESLYPFLAKKYPELFEVEQVQTKKSSKDNAVRINDTKFTLDNNDSSEQNIVGE